MSPFASFPKIKAWCSCGLPVAGKCLSPEARCLWLSSVLGNISLTHEADAGLWLLLQSPWLWQIVISSFHLAQYHFMSASGFPRPSLVLENTLEICLLCPCGHGSIHLHSSKQCRTLCYDILTLLSVSPGS